MNDIQAIILDVFKEIKSICENHNLKYYAIGGTCIGAIRHKGFIPWDDDMDLAMPIDDYKRFIDIAKEELHFPYELYLPEMHPHWMGNYIKVHNVETAYCEPDSLVYPDRMTGINIDIMPLYGVPKSQLKREICQIKNDYYHYMNRRLKSPASVTNKTANSIFKFISSIDGSKNNMMLYCERIDKCFAKYPLFESDKVLFGWRDRVSYKKRAFHYIILADSADFKDSLEVPFENIGIRVPSGYDHYLSLEYGNYMKIPPKEKQINHQPQIIDLCNSYKKYQAHSI